MPARIIVFVVGVALAAAACGGDAGTDTDTALASGAEGSVAADLDAAAVTFTPIAKMERPTALALRPRDATLYVAEQEGRVRAVHEGIVISQPVLDIARFVALDRREQGLLGLAFSPDGSRLYVHYTDRRSNGSSQIDEYRMKGKIADPSTRRPVLTVESPQPSHNGGQLAFGPDGLLYIALGDGGGRGDQSAGHEPEGNGQSLDTLLGKILRIDPTPSGNDPYTIPSDNPFASGGGRAEIWAFGLRNPWRFSFDRERGDLWIADVGQSAWEEIDYLPAGHGAGANFGWARLEGSHEFSGEPPLDAVAPIFEYPNPDEGCAIVGGFVYRGTRIPNLVGAYVFTDYCDGRLRALRQENGQVVLERFLGVRGEWIAAFGESSDGELYVLSHGGGLLRIDPA